MKMKSFNGVTRRRGTTIAAAALSVALVAPFVHPIASPQSAAVANAQEAGATNSGADVIEADAIANGYIRSATGMTNAKSTLSGRAYIDDGSGFGPTDAGNLPVPEGTTVYMQWIDKDGAVSPVYSAKTSNQLSKDKTSQAGPGAYAFDLRQPWTDVHGKEHTYTASADQYYKLWINPFTDERNGATVTPFRQVGGFFPGAFRDSAGADQQGAWNTIGTNMQRTAVIMQNGGDTSYMHKPKAEWVEDTEETLPRQATNLDMKNHVGGRVWLETSDIRVDGPDMTGSDVAASGYNVVMSVLTPEGIGEYAAKVETLPVAQQQAAAKQLLEEHPEYIAETVTTKTDAKGYYSVKFPDGKLTNQSKDYLYAHVESPDGKPMIGYSGWRLPLYQSPKENGGRNPHPIAAENFVANPMWYNVNFAMVPKHNVSLNITNYDMTENPARKGDTPILDVKGPFPVTPNKIVWKKNGDILEDKTCEGITSEAEANKCVFPVPEDAVNGDVFTAEFVTGDDTSIAADSFVVTDEPITDDLDPSYEDKLVVPGEETKSSPTFTGKDGKDVEAPKDSKFAISDDFTAPEGYEVSIDENTGEITVTSPDGSELDKDTVEEFEVPVKVTYPDETTDDAKAKFELDTDGDGTPDSKDDDDDNDGISDEEEKDKGSNPKDKGSIPGTPLEPGNPTDAATFDPSYEDKLVVPGEETKSSPTFTGKDGKDVEAPKDSKFAISDDFTAPEGYEVSIDENTGEITVTSPDGSELDKDTVEEFEVPVKVTYPDETTDDAKAKFELDTDGDGTPDSKDDDDDNDGISDEEEKDKGSNPKDKGSIPGTPLEPGNPTDAATFDPSYEDKLVVPGEETKSSPTFTGKDGKDVEAPKDSKFAISDDFTAPEGYEVSIDENTGEITVTSPDGSELDKDTVEEFEVPVKVTYPDETTDDAKAKFELDTDGDGTPDSKDDDDDNDGISDEEEKDKGSNPKDKGSIPGTPLEPGNPTDAATFDPSYEDKLVVPGEETKSSPTFTGKDGKDVEAPKDSKFAISDDFTAPEGYEVSIDENTGEITVTSPDGSELDKDTVEEFEVPVKVTYPDETTDDAKAKFELDTDGDGTPDSKDDDDDNDGISDEEEKDKGSNPKDKGSIPGTPLEPGNPTDAATFDPSYEDGSGKPGDDVTVPAPEFKDNEGNPAEAPEGTEFTPGDNAPDGVTVDENTGEITVPVPEDAKPGDKITVPVDVTYPDDTKDTVDVTVTVGEPDAPDAKDNETFEPGYEDGSGKPGDDVTVPAPEFKDNEGNPAEAPEGTEFTPGDNAPDGVTVDENTGEITVPVPEDAKPGDKITVPVDVTYPDDTKDTVDVTVTVGEPDAPDAKDNETFEPGYEDGSGKPGDNVTVPAPEFKDNEGNPAEAPEGTEFTPGDNAPDGVTVDENTGEITVPVPEDAKPGDKITVPVDVTYPDDTKDTVDVTVTVGEPDAPDAKDNETFEPGYEDGSGKPGDDVTVPAPEFKDNEGNPAEAPEGTEFTPGDNAPDGVTVDENTGEITVPVPEDAKPGDKITVPVDVTYPDDTKDTVDVTVTVGEPKDNSGSSDGGSSIPGGSSNVDWERCAPAAAGLGLPLLFLLPIGLASQMNIPGFSPLVKQVSAQIDGINRQLGQQNVALQKQLGIYNGPLAKQANQINLMLKKVSAEASRIGGGVALAAAGALALGLLINSCAPGAGSSSSSK